MPDDPTAPLRTILRDERRRRGLSQRQLADTLRRKTNSDISHWETGTVEPRLSTFTAWAAALGYRVDLVPTEDIDG